MISEQIKTATLVLKMKTDSGHKVDATFRIEREQWRQIMQVLCPPKATLGGES